MFYIKHLRYLLEKAGADPRDFKSKQMLDDCIREVLGMEKADAPLVWEKVKAILFAPNADPAKRKEFEEQVTKLMVRKLIVG
jgi:hypothetical protein